MSWNALYHLNGYIDAFPPAALKTDMLLLQIADTRHSFELENYPISFTRLFEAYSSENALNDPKPELIFNFLAYYRLQSKIDINTLRPLYDFALKKQEIFRDKKEITVKSYNTNLTLYTAPNQYAVIRNLRDELDFLFRNPLEIDELLQMCLCHFQIRALAPFNHFNQHTARTYSNLWVKSQQLNFNFLPISGPILKSKETYQLMMREITNSENYEAWCLYLLEMMREAATNMLKTLKEIQSMKKNTLDIMAKYTSYQLPSDELLPIIFSKPYIKPKYLIEGLDCHRQTAYAYLNHLVRAGILIEKKSGREKLYLHKQLFDVLSN